MFNTNNEYARKYDEWRRKEELRKLQDKYGEDYDDEEESSSSSESEDDPMDKYGDDYDDEEESSSSSESEDDPMDKYGDDYDDEDERSSSSESEDDPMDKYGDDYNDEEESSSSSESEDDPMLTNPKLQEDWLKTLEALKNKDPKIYQKDYHFFEDPEGEDEDDDDGDSEPKTDKKKEKPMYLKDYERKVILEKGGIISSDEEEEEVEDVKTYNQEQEELRQQFVQAAGSHNDSDNDEGIGGGLFVKRKRTMDEVKEEEREQEEWNKEQEQFNYKRPKTEEIGIEAEPLSTKDISSIEDRQEFLKNYILGQSYLEQDKSRIPTYDEVVYDEDDDDKQNFRSEEAGSTEVKTFPRGSKHLIRQKDNKRAEKRTAVKERKRTEKEKKKEELKRLKNLKRQEILDKIEKLKEVTGNDSLGFNEDDIEGDFDPDKYDKMMENQFNDNYYAVEGEEDKANQFNEDYYAVEGEADKPIFDMSDDEFGENMDEWTGDADLTDYTGGSGGGGGDYNEGPHVDDPDFCMDADYDPSAPKPMSRKKMKKLRNKKNKHKLIDILEQEKPLFNPDEKSFEDYLDEYYNLDFEDIIDDIPCRFKYRKVTPYSYGLTEEEILNSDEKELDRWVKLKRMNKYRTEEGEQQHIEGFQKRAKNRKLKKKVLATIYKPPEEKEKEEEEADDFEGKTKKKKRKKGKKFKRDRHAANSDEKGTEGNQGTPSTSQQLENNEPENSENVTKKSKSMKVGSEDSDGVTVKTEKQGAQNSVDKGKKKNKDGQNKDKKDGGKKEKKKHHKKKIMSEERMKAYGLDPKTIKYATEGRFNYKYKQKR